MCTSLEYAEVHGLELYRSHITRQDIPEPEKETLIKWVEKRIKDLRKR